MSTPSDPFVPQEQAGAAGLPTPGQDSSGQSQYGYGAQPGYGMQPGYGAQRASTGASTS